VVQASSHKSQLPTKRKESQRPHESSPPSQHYHRHPQARRSSRDDIYYGQSHYTNQQYPQHYHSYAQPPQYEGRDYQSERQYYLAPQPTNHHHASSRSRSPHRHHHQYQRGHDRRPYPDSHHPDDRENVNRRKQTDYRDL
jgi:hypothetical protein